MPDNQVPTSAEQEQIRVDTEEETERWASILGVTPDQLREAVRQVGPGADDVKARLGEIQVRHS